MKMPHLVLFAWLAAPAAAAGQDIPVQLLFDGKPLRSTATPAFTCLDTDRHVWIACHVSSEPGPDGYVMTRPAPGHYTLHVEIDANKTNPARFPGDYDVFYPFEVTAGSPVVLRVDMPKLMRLRLPWDNNRSLDGMLTRPWSEKPVIATGGRPASATGAVTFRWDPIVRGADYSYVVRIARDAPFERGPDVVSGTTRETSITVLLPKSAAEHYFQFGLSARHDGRPVGEFFTRDAGVQAWTVEFVVRDRSGSPAAAKVAAPSGRRPDDRRRTGNAAFLAEWTEAVPKPEWWDSVPRSALAIHSLGDLMAVWQSGTSDDAARQRFYKLTYQAILDHPGDPHIGAVGIHLMSYTADSSDRFPLLRFGVDHFFLYDQRTDNCVHCKIGDTSADMVRDLAEAYISRGDPDAAITIVERLVREREPDVSDYKLALAFETMSRAYWNLKDVNGAKAAIQEGLRRFPDGWQADQLRRTLARYDNGSQAIATPR